MHEGGGRWVGSNKLVELKKKKKNLAEDFKRQFSKDDIHTGNRHMKRQVTLLIIREIQVKTSMSCHLTLV